MVFCEGTAVLPARYRATVLLYGSLQACVLSTVHFRAVAVPAATKDVATVLAVDYVDLSMDLE